MILILEGITFLKAEIIILPQTITKTTDIDITNACCNCTVIAKAEQIPKT